MAPQTGKSSIELDADSINILLSEFVNQPDSYQVEYRDGKLHVDQGSFQIVVDQLPLANTTLEIHYQQVGTVGVKVEQFDLTPNSVKANLELGIKR